jgi:hypothetical protein
MANVSGTWYNSRMKQNWFKYTYVCSICDALIEITNKTNVYAPYICCNIEAIWLSVVDATIHPTQTKEETMEETTTPAVPDTYNANLLVTYKVIHGYSDPEYATVKVASLEWDLHNARQTQKSNGVLHSKIDSVKDIITEAYADSDDQDTLRAIAEALGIELTREVEWSATIEVSGTISVDLLEGDADVEQEIYDNLYVDSQNGQIEIVDTEVTNVREN